MIRGLFQFCLTLAALVFLTGAVFAQDGPDYDTWDAVASRAEEAVETAQASDQAFETLRQELDEWRDRFQAARSINSAQITAVEAQIAALGPKPEDGNEAETVFIPEDDRGTLCVSSQVGCTLTCRFCHTGTQRLVRNLTPADIIGQVMLARDTLGEWPSPGENRRLTNIVMMGMGEPLYNTGSVIKALKIIQDGEGIALSKRRITLSTSGVVPEIGRVGAETGVQLAISLHATNDALRDQIMPLNKKYPLKELLQAVRDYPGLSNANRVTWEYIMLKGVNDSVEHAQALVDLIDGIPSKINLIPFNPWPGSPYERSSNNAIRRFADVVWNAGYSSPIRTTRGEDILAACGQLKSESERIPAYKLREQTAGGCGKDDG